MARSTIKGTYTLDVETVRTLDALAKRWRTSKSAALRRVIRAAATSAPAELETSALDQLQRRAALTRAAADRWVAGVREERRAR